MSKLLFITGVESCFLIFHKHQDSRPVPLITLFDFKIYHRTFENITLPLLFHHGLLHPPFYLLYFLSTQ